MLKGLINLYSVITYKWRYARFMKTNRKKFFLLENAIFEFLFTRLIYRVIHRREVGMSHLDLASQKLQKMLYEKSTSVND